MRKLNPHMWVTALSPPRQKPCRIWMCQYCGIIGPMNTIRAVACSHVYPPCKYCGQTPECARDCPGIAMALSLPQVYVAGRGPSNTQN